MELSAKYVYKVFQEKSFSKAAKALYISQPALSAAVSRLENEMGIKIFDRTRVPLNLTPQGRIYIDTIEEIMESESNMKRRLQEISDLSNGSITVGGSSHVTNFLLPEICGEFYKKYPKIRVTLDIGNVGDVGVLTDKLNNRTIDLLMAYDYDNNIFTAEPIINERLIIAMRKTLKGADKIAHLAISREDIISGNWSKEQEISDLSIFRDITFIKYTKRSNLTHKMNQILGEYKVSNYHIVNSRHIGVHHNLMCSGLGAIMTSDLAISKAYNNSEDILYFVPACKESYRTLYFVKNRLVKPNPISENFIKTTKETLQNI